MERKCPTWATTQECHCPITVQSATGSFSGNSMAAQVRCDHSMQMRGFMWSKRHAMSWYELSLSRQLLCCADRWQLKILWTSKAWITRRSSGLIKYEFCAVEQAALYLTSAWSKTCSVEHAGSLQLGSLHTWGALFGESMSHHPRVLTGYWVHRLSPVKWRLGRHPHWIRKTMNETNPWPENHVLCIACVIKKKTTQNVQIHLPWKHTVVTTERRVLETGSWRGTAAAERGPTASSTLGYTYVAQGPEKMVPEKMASAKMALGKNGSWN